MIKDLLREHEGLRLVAYPDPGSKGDPWTIGYGHTRGVKPGDTCTVEQAEAWLDEDLREAYRIVNTEVKVPLTESQRDALASFVFNVGPGIPGKKDGFAVLKSGEPSTLLRKLNAGDYRGAAAQFDRWVYASGIQLPGLTRRRQAERKLFEATLTTPNPQENPMPTPIASSILLNALPSLFNALPELAAVFKKKDVAERNAEAIAKVGTILVQASGATNVQEAVERVQADPETARDVNEALKLNRADIMDIVERLARMDEDSIAAAREFSRDDKPVIGRWLFVHILSVLFVILGGGAAWYVLVHSEDPTERVMALQTLLIVGFASVAGFWLGSSRSSQVKDLIKEQ